MFNNHHLRGFKCICNVQAGIAEVVYYTDKGAHVDKNAGGTEPAYIASRRLLSMAGVKVTCEASLRRSFPSTAWSAY